MRHDIIEYAEVSPVIGRTVTVTVDRPLGSYHPEHKDMYYPINYGYVDGTGRRRAGCLHIRCG